MAEGARAASNISVARMSHAYAISERSKSPMESPEKITKTKPVKVKKMLTVSASQELLNKDIDKEIMTV